MAIDWSLAKQPDIIGNAYASLRQGQQAGREQQARNAYATYAQDPEAGIKALMPYDPAAATQLSTARRQEERQTTQDGLDAEERKRKAFTESVSLLSGFGRRVRSPADLEGLKANPVFQQVYARATADLGLKTPLEALTVDQVHAFNTEASKIQGVNLGGGGYGTFDPDSGDFKTIREPTDRPVIIGNGATAIDPDTGEPIYTNRKTFAPPRAASGGGAAASLPPGYAPR